MCGGDTNDTSDSRQNYVSIQLQILTKTGGIQIRDTIQNRTTKTWIAPHLSSTLQLMPNFLPGDFSKSFPRNAASDSICLCVALPEVHRVRVVRLRESGLDELLHFKNGRDLEVV